MTNAMESWSWQGCEGKKAEIEVYARAAEVALLLNGVEVGRKKAKNDCRFVFECAYQPGKLEAVAYDTAGQEIGRCALVSAAAATELRAEPEAATVQPGHLCYIRLRYTDPAGIAKPLCTGRIQVSVQGGRLLALGNGCPFNAEGYLNRSTLPYWGEALAIVQADDASQIQFCATGGSLTAEAVIPIRKE